MSSQDFIGRLRAHVIAVLENERSRRGLSEDEMGKQKIISCNAIGVMIRCVGL